MPARHGSWDSFPQFIRWSRPPSFYVRQVSAPPPAEREAAQPPSAPHQGWQIQPSRRPVGDAEAPGLKRRLQGLWQSCFALFRSGPHHNRKISL